MGVFSEGRRRLLAITGITFAVMATAPAFAALGFYLPSARHAKLPKTRAIEDTALLLLREQRIEDAIALLEAAVDGELSYRHGTVSLRLLDLLATVYARKGQLEKLSALAGRVQATAERRSHVPRIATALGERAGKWDNQHSKWRRDRANPEAIIKWRWAKHETRVAEKSARRDDIVIAV
ncbi:MAG: hypothetical protein H7X89_15860 [Rhizobiales bacterium]|nr:hypothetical protein [Hyphomicrobiales bacterium]